jgi:hypothetical protein
MRSSSTHIAEICLAMLAVLGACSADLGKLRPPPHKDAASSTDLSPAPEDVAGQDRNGAAPRDVSGDTGAQAMRPEVQGEGGFDGGPTLVDAVGIDGSADTGDSTDSSDRADAGGSGGSRAESGTEVAEVGAGMDVVQDVPEAIGSVVDGSATADGDGVVDVSGSGRPEAADTRASTDETGGDVAADSPVVVDAGGDTFAVDARGKMICPTTINGSIDSSDATQLGRLARYAPVSACGTRKSFPGSAEATNLHFYDAYHFINPTGAPVCFNFTLTYPGYEQLYVAVYSVADPTNITTSYLGDVGGVLTSPQTMGITVDAYETIDVVVYAISTSTAAGSYTLSCTTQ